MINVFKSLTKKYNFFEYFITFLILLFLIPGILFAQTGQEKITSFHTKINVTESGNVIVEETITYDFSNNQKRGIIRTIPLNKSSGSLKRIDIEVLSVKDVLGNPYEYIIENNVPHQINIRIGNPHKYITGEHTYIIEYEVKNTIGSFKNFSEIYWNSTGDEWEIDIFNASTQVILPSFIRQYDLQIKSYCGPRGSRSACSIETEVSYLDNFTVINLGNLNSLQNLYSGSGMTIAIGFPKGIIQEVSWIIPWLVKALSYILYILPFVITCIWFRKRIKFWLKKKKFYGKNVLVTKYEADLDPLESAFIMDGYVSERAISAQIIYLAIQGYLVINKQYSEFIFYATEKSYEHLSLYNQKLLDGLKNKNESALKNSFYKTFDLVKDLVRKSVIDKKYSYSKRYTDPIPRATLFVIWLGIAIYLGLFLILLDQKVAYAFSFSSILIGTTYLIFGGNWSLLSDEGLYQQRKLLGLKKYINVAEKDRISFHNDPKRNPKIFEVLLPYAVIFNLEKKWVEQFKDFMFEAPWYDTGNKITSIFTFGAAINNFISQTSFVIDSRPASSRTSSSGTSSGSRGGSSGGGGGGGGGRSW
jgi:uncharacterized membrane protein YgcG